MTLGNCMVYRLRYQIQNFYDLSSIYYDWPGWSAKIVFQEI